jgi:small conductance mechanosensitive channel
MPLLSSWRRWVCLNIAVVFLTIFSPVAFSQTELAPVPVSPSPAEVETPDGLYFDDVIVRGRPLFQVGSLPEISATQRAEIISRRIASLLTQVEDPEAVSVQYDPAREIATLQVNNRILMTVTQQDAEDFGLSVQELAEQWATQLNQALERQILVVDVGQRVYGTIRGLIRDAIASFPAVIGAIIIVLLTWIVAKIARRGFRIWAEQTEGDSNTELLIGRLGYGGVWIIGTIIALGILGLDFATLLATLGLTSVAIGFSLKDVLSNYISGVILLAARPFRINDQVVIGDYEGTITQIQLRATTMKTYDGRTVYIPNQEVFEASIINNTASTKRRSSVIVGIDYDADLSEAAQVILAALEPIIKVEKYPEPEVLVQELAASTVNLEVRFWVNSQRANFLQTTSEATQAIKEALEKAEIGMPTDIYTLIFRNSPLKTDDNQVMHYESE